MHEEVPEGKVAIDLLGGPWSGTHAFGDRQDTPDGLPVALWITIDADPVMGIPLGKYLPSGKHCDHGHPIYIWTVPDVNRN